MRGSARLGLVARSAQLDAAKKKRSQANQTEWICCARPLEAIWCVCRSARPHEQRLMAHISSQLDRISLLQCTYVVGDIHGRFDLLEKILEKIDDDIVRKGHSDPRLIFAGDYIDRGEQSAEVLQRLCELTTDWPANVTCLMGNHEDMLLGFLNDPVANGSRWLRNGGLQTLASFRVGMRGFGEAPTPADLQSGAVQLRERMGHLVNWLHDLPLYWNEENLCVVHAGADPKRPVSDQTKKTLLWGHPEFGNSPRNDGTWIAHGHIVVNKPRIKDGVISIDTGAVFSNRLTVAAITPDGSVSFLEAS